MTRAWLPALSAVFAAVACQTYDFEPMRPRAFAQTTIASEVGIKNLRPNLMILLDKSLSMDDPIPGAGESRMQAMRRAMSTFLNLDPAVARTALTLYPAQAPCVAASAVAIPFSPPSATENPTQDLSKAREVLAQIQATTPGGGTPTGASLQFVGSLTDLQQEDGRSDFVLLLTDGLPNCNSANPNNCGNVSSCRCTLSGGLNACGSPGGSSCIIGCLDQDATVRAVQALRQKGIRTIVVGFGADTASGDAPAVLNALAAAGGFPRSCPKGTDAECGTGNTCEPATLTCVTQFYQATNAAELGAALALIAQGIVKGDPCVFSLETKKPIEDPAFIAVIFGGKNLPRGDTTWQYAFPPDAGGSAPSVILKGTYCDAIANSTTQNPVRVEIRAVETL